MALHRKIMGRAHRNEERPEQLFKGGELVRPRNAERNVKFAERVNFSVWSFMFGAPTWAVNVNGEWWDQADLLEITK